MWNTQIVRDTADGQTQVAAVAIFLIIFGTRLNILFIIKKWRFSTMRVRVRKSNQVIRPAYLVSRMDWLIGIADLLSLFIKCLCLYISIMELRFNQKLNAPSLGHLFENLRTLAACTHTTKIDVLVSGNLYKEEKKKRKELSALLWPIIVLHEDQCPGRFWA